MEVSAVAAMASVQSAFARVQLVKAIATAVAAVIVAVAIVSAFAVVRLAVVKEEYEGFVRSGSSVSNSAARGCASVLWKAAGWNAWADALAGVAAVA